MSGASPSRTIRRRADLSDLFRGSSSGPSSSPKKEVQSLPATDSAPAPDVVHVQPSSTTLKRVATKIPFLGRGRKKSTPSVKSGYMSAEATRGYESSDVDKTAGKKNRRFSQPLASPKPAIAKPPLPKSSPQSRPSLSSKFAAHLSGKSRKDRTPAKHADGTVSDTVAVQRQPSVESTSTNGSEKGRETPRGRPTITISSSPEGLEEYKDLFTLPRRKGSAVVRTPTTPASEYRDLYHDGASNVTLAPVTQTNPRPINVTLETMSEIARREARQLAEGHVSTPLSKQKKPISLPNLAEIDDSAGTAPSIDITPAPSHSGFSSLPRSRTRLRSSAASKERSLPPNIPLPLPPVESPPKSPSIKSTTQASPRQSSQSILSPTDSNIFPPRSRSNTLGSVAPSQKSTSRPTSWASQRRCSRQLIEKEVTNILAIIPDKDNIDVDSLTIDELKQALKKRSDQYEELVGHLLELTKSHAAEKISLEKKIRILEMELVRKDKQVQGFTWFFNNRTHQSDPSMLASSDGVIEKSTSMEDVLRLQPLAGTTPAIVTPMP